MAMFYRDNSRALYISLAAVLLSRLFYYYFFGISFDYETIHYYWQYIDPILLQTNLLESLFYLQSQPPGYNLFLGLVLKAFPFHYPSAFFLIYLVLGLIWTVALFLLMIRLGVNQWISSILVILFMSSPSVVLYENWLSYGYIVAVFLTLSALFLHKFLTEEKMGFGVLFFLTLGILSLTRAYFHLFWFIFIIIFLFASNRRLARQTLIACSIPFIVLTLIYIKHFMLFGLLSFSSHIFGSNIADMIQRYSTETFRTDYILEHGYPGMLLFNDPYPPDLTRIKDTGFPEMYGVAILDEEYKSNGYSNHNHIKYLTYSNRYLDDALIFMGKKPVDTLMVIFKNYYRYFLPSSNWVYPFDSSEDVNYKKISTVDRLYNLLFFWQLGYSRISWLLIIGVPFLLVYTIHVLIQEKIYKNPNAFSTTLAYMLLSIILLGIAGMLVPTPQRLRFNIDAFYLVFLGLMLTVLSQKITSKRIKDI